MRDEKKNGISVRYPDEIGFAFNPCLVIAEGEKMSTMEVFIYVEGEEQNGKTVSIKEFNGMCYADMREYVQSYFDDIDFGVDYTKPTKTDMGIRLSFEVRAFTARHIVVAYFQFDVFYIWGALKVGGKEVYNGRRTLTCFKGYPFTFGIYSPGNSSILVGTDGVSEDMVRLPEQGVWNVPLNPDDAINYFTINDDSEEEGGYISNVTFDKTFDMTFQHIGSLLEQGKIRVNVEDDCENGYYLRWVNRHGFYCYYLFKPGERTVKASSDGVFLRNNLMAYSMEYGYGTGVGRLQGMKREEVQPICAPLVDSETWDMLSDIATSPCVDLFVGYKSDIPRWVSVSIGAASYTKKGAVLQDFVCQITMPEIPVQKL